MPLAFYNELDEKVVSKQIRQKRVKQQFIGGEGRGYDQRHIIRQQRQNLPILQQKGYPEINQPTFNQPQSMNDCSQPEIDLVSFTSPSFAPQQLSCICEPPPHCDVSTVESHLQEQTEVLETQKQLLYKYQLEAKQQRILEQELLKTRLQQQHQQIVSQPRKSQKPTISIDEFLQLTNQTTQVSRYQPILKRHSPIPNSQVQITSFKQYETEKRTVEMGQNFGQKIVFHRKDNTVETLSCVPRSSPAINVVSANQKQLEQEQLITKMLKINVDKIQICNSLNLQDSNQSKADKEQGMKMALIVKQDSYVPVKIQKLNTCLPVPIQQQDSWIPAPLQKQDSLMNMAQNAQNNQQLDEVTVDVSVANTQLNNLSSNSDVTVSEHLPEQEKNQLEDLMVILKENVKKQDQIIDWSYQ